LREGSELLQCAGSQLANRSRTRRDDVGAERDKLLIPVSESLDPADAFLSDLTQQPVALGQNLGVAR